MAAAPATAASAAEAPGVVHEIQKEPASKSLDSVERVRWKTTAVTIAARRSFRVPIPVEGSDVVHYVFRTEGLDIGFEVRFVSDAESRVLVEARRVASHEAPVEGRLGPLGAAGRLEFLWDNEYSWFTDKTLVYRIELEIPRGRLRSPCVALNPLGFSER